MIQELRYAWRQLRESPVFAVIVILTLALGIGANTAVFSVVHGVMLEPLPYKDPARLVDIFDRSLKDSNGAHAFGTLADFDEYARHAHSFEKIAFGTVSGPAVSMTRGGATRYVTTVFASEDFFAIPGIAAARGRTFGHDDLSRGCSVVLSDPFWSSVLNSDPAMIGKDIELNHGPCRVLGVMPAQFEFYNRGTELWMLLTPQDPMAHDQFYGFSFARLKPGVTVAQALAEVTALHQHMPQPGASRDYRPVVNNLADDFAFLAGSNLRTTLKVLLFAVALVLLIACLNVANLLVARASAREGEFAIRAALGCSRARLIRQLLVEGLFLAAIGGAGGVAVAIALVKYFVHVNPIELPIGSHVSVNVPVLAFAFVVTIGTSLIFAIVPAWSASQATPDAHLRAAGRGATSRGARRLTRALIVGEISLSLMLISAAGLLLRSVLAFGAAPLGFDPDHVLLSYLNLPAPRYAENAAKLQTYEALRARLGAIPGVESSAVSAASAPFGFGASEVELDGRTRSEMQDVGENSVSPDYFGVLGIALHRGRLLTRQDGASSAPVAVVNEKFAAAYFPGVDPVGQRLRVAGQPASSIEIVGVVGTEKQPDYIREMSWREQPIVYRPIAQRPSSFLFVEVRTHGDQLGVGRAMERTIGAMDSGIPVGWLFAMKEVVGRRFTYPRFRAIVLAQFSGFALLLAGLGLHGLLSQYVTQRRRELGLRMAIGARPGDILRLVATQCGMPLLIGVGAGMLLTFAMTRYLTTLLFGVSPDYPLTMIAAPIALLVVALVAAMKPALDAAAVDPMQALAD